MKRIVAISRNVKHSVLDDDYTLFEDGEVLHQYDRHSSPGGQNHEETLLAIDLDSTVKERLLLAASFEDKVLVKNLLGI